jgi:hypothetical protein
MVVLGIILYYYCYYTPQHLKIYDFTHPYFIVSEWCTANSTSRYTVAVQ